MHYLTGNMPFKSLRGRRRLADITTRRRNAQMPGNLDVDIRPLSSYLQSYYEFKVWYWLEGQINMIISYILEYELFNVM